MRTNQLRYLLEKMDLGRGVPALYLFQPSKLEDEVFSWPSGFSVGILETFTTRRPWCRCCLQTGSTQLYKVIARSDVKIRLARVKMTWFMSGQYHWSATMIKLSLISGKNKDQAKVKKRLSPFTAISIQKIQEYLQKILGNWSFSLC